MPIPFNLLSYFRDWFLLFSYERSIRFYIEYVSPSVFVVVSKSTKKMYSIYIYKCCLFSPFFRSTTRDGRTLNEGMNFVHSVVAIGGWRFDNRTISVQHKETENLILKFKLCYGTWYLLVTFIIIDAGIRIAPTEDESREYTLRSVIISLDGRTKNNVKNIDTYWNFNWNNFNSVY